MSFMKTTSAALVAAAIAFGAMTPVSTAAFASDQGFSVAPVKQAKKAKSFKIAGQQGKFGKLKLSKTEKYLAIGAAVGVIGYALVSEALDRKRY